MQVFTFHMLVYWNYVYRKISSVLKTASCLNTMEYCILQEIVRSNNNLSKDIAFTFKNLARKLSCTPAAITLTTETLQKQGYVEKERYEQDSRKMYLHLTKEGAAAAHNADVALVRFITDLFEPIEDREKETILRSSLKTVHTENRLRVDRNGFRADTAFIEGMLLSYKRFARESKRQGLSLAKTIVLYAINENDGILTAADISKKALLPYNNVYPLIKELCIEGLAEGVGDSIRSTRFLYKITSRGQKKLKSILDCLSRIYDVPAVDLQVFRDVCGKVVTREQRHLV